MNARKGYILASAGAGFLAASLLLSPPLRGAGTAAIDAAARGIKVMVVNDAAGPVLVSQVSDPAAARKPFVRWIEVDLSKGEPLVKAHFFDVPAGQRVVLEYLNVDMCTPPAITHATINLLTGYVDPATGQTRQQQLKLITQPQGVFPDDDVEGLYAHYGVSQQMNVYIEPGMPVDAYIYRDLRQEGHSEAHIWASGYMVPTPAGQ
jgi:hypothetical protein